MKTFLKTMDIPSGTLAQDTDFLANRGNAPCHYALVHQVHEAMPIDALCPTWIPFAAVMHDLFRNV